MKTAARIFFLAIGLLLSFSCGTSARQVKYVYIDGPQYSPAPTQNDVHTYQKTNSEIAKQPHHESSTSNRTVEVKTGQQPFANCVALANEKVPGYYRGFGESKGDDFEMAYSEAMDVAIADAAKKVVSLVDRFTKQRGDKEQSQTKKKYWREISSHIVHFQVMDPEVIKMEYSSGPIYDVAVCVQFAAEDVFPFLEDAISKLSKEEQQDLKNAINQQKL